MSAESEDLYALLGVDLTASEQQIRRAYRRRIVYSHRQGVLGLVEQIKALEHAYQTLRDPALRRGYDLERSSSRSSVFPSERIDPATAQELAQRTRMASERTREAERNGAVAQRATAETMRQLALEHESRELRSAQIRARKALRARVLRVLSVLLLIAAGLYFGLR